jgi:hypothetical protein
VRRTHGMRTPAIHATIAMIFDCSWAAPEEN